jgi:glycosyltransferase involved in cell wall biosynthesis
MAATKTQKAPLITFAIFAYNQESFIRDAVTAALAQTYSPLEIIVSDDCSSDLTFSVIEDVAASYQGPHDLKIRRNSQNLGIAGHVNEMARVASGEILVLAAGDDISLPNRVSVLAQVFDRNPDVRAVFSNYETLPTGISIRENSFLERVSQEELLANGGGVQIGATYAYSKYCFTWPTPLPGWIVSEDRILPFRAAILGSVRYSTEALVRYRISNDPEEIKKRANRVHSYNDNRHWQLLADAIVTGREDGYISLMRSVYLLTLLRTLRLSVLSARGHRTKLLARGFFVPVRFARKVSRWFSQGAA